MRRDYWDPKLETLPPEQRQTLRKHRLHWQVKRCWDGSPFYRARLEAAGLDAALAGGFDAWQRLPVLRGSDLPATADWAVAPESWWARLDEVAGHPARVVTDGDAIQQIDLAARAVWAAGARPGGIFPFPSPAADPSTRSAIELAAGRVGATLGGDGAPFAPLVSLPFVAPVVAYRCEEGRRVHWNDDHFLVEVVTPDGGHPVAPGNDGAVLLTDLGREGSPLLRYWTGLETSMSDDPCACGRTSAWSASVRRLP
jgi:phenylacetate-coenzyme A ligase PaaK-like adenylate-forming protein